MDREQVRMAILEQEQIFRQQVHELHRLYHVQRHLMQATATASRAPATVSAAGARPGLVISSNAKPTHPQQFLSFSRNTSSKKQLPATAPAEECNLELTLATGPGGGGGKAGWQPLTKTSSNSDSGTTAVSSTSTDSELAQFREAEAARFGSESRRMNGGAWMYRCLSLRTA